MNCPHEHERMPLIDRYIRGELPEGEKERFEEHYFACDECFEALRESRLLAETIRRKGKKIFPESAASPVSRDSVRNDFFNGWKTYAAAALIAAGLIYLIFSITDRSDVVPYPLITLDDTAKTKRPDDEIRKNANSDSIPVIRKIKRPALLADTYAPSPYLEYYINRSFRSEVMTEWFSPPDSSYNPQQLTFRWKFRQDERLSLKLLNNKEKVVFQTSINSGFSLNVSDLRLKRGLYYWKAETDIDLVRVGKFIIN